MSTIQASICTPESGTSVYDTLISQVSSPQASFDMRVPVTFLTSSLSYVEADLVMTPTKLRSSSDAGGAYIKVIGEIEFACGNDHTRVTMSRFPYFTAVVVKNPDEEDTLELFETEEDAEDDFGR